MIQRIQSVYLILSMLCVLIMLYVPFGVIEQSEPLESTLLELTNKNTGEVVHTNWVCVITALIFMIVQALTIFRYKNRIRQIRLARLSLVVLVALVVSALLVSDMYALLFNGESIPEKMTYSWTLGILVLPWVFTYLAIRGIKKDEALIRSADRLR